MCVCVRASLCVSVLYCTSEWVHLCLTLSVCFGASSYWRQQRARRSALPVLNADGVIYLDLLSGPALCRRHHTNSKPTSPPTHHSQTLQVLLHNYLVSRLSWKWHLESDHSPHMGAGLFTPNPPLSLNVPFVPFIITILRECHTLPNEKETSSVWATAHHTPPFPDCRAIPRRNHNCSQMHNSE